MIKFQSDKKPALCEVHRIYALCAVMLVLAGVSYWLDADAVLFALLVVSCGFLIKRKNTEQSATPGDPGVRRLDKTAFMGFLDAALNDVNATGTTGCVILELDNSSEIRRDWGDEVIVRIRDDIVIRLGSLLRQYDCLALLDDNRVAIALCNVRTPELGGVLSLIERLQKGCEMPVKIDNGTIHVSLSAGFCLQQKAREQNGAGLCDAALLALSEARQHGPSSVRAYSASTPKTIAKVGKSVDEVMAALDAGHISPWFQPQISSDTGEITGFEALARWENPTLGLIAPNEFLPVLESAQKMELLREAILHHSLKAVQKWDREGANVPSVSVNFSTQDLRNPSLVQRIKWDVDRLEIDPARLSIEILETVVSETEDDIITRNIGALHDQGFKLDLDDFGTGHASLSNIRRFGVDRIKIDRCFVARCDDDPDQQRMIAAILGMSEQLGIETIAEGVETQGEYSILSQLGCTHLQGFAIARAMPFDQTLDWMAKHRKQLADLSSLGKRTG